MKRADVGIPGWVGGAMVLFLVALVVSALLPDGFGKEWLSSLGTPLPASQQTGAVAAGGGDPAAPVAARKAPAQLGMMPFEQAPQVRFDGKIQQVTEFQQQDGQIHIWIHDQSGRELQISVAPRWFLEYMGCQLTHDIPVAGQGFRFDNQGADPLIYAQKIRVNGKNCRLRNDEGFALWSNRLR